MKTLAAILEKTGQPLVLAEVDVPMLKPGQVLVDVKYSSICHTQINEVRGLKGEDKFLPHTLGHEGFGVVCEIGEGVTKVAPGDEVVLTWLQGSGMNVISAHYVWNGRTVNSGAVSTFLKYALISENRVIKASGVPAELMPLLGCAVPTGMGIVLNNMKPKPGHSVAVWGLGGIGLCVVMGATSERCSPVIAIDINPKKLEVAKLLGATHLVDARHDPIQQVLKITGGQGVDFGVDAVGMVQTIEQGYATTRRGGGKFVIAGNPPAGQKISLDPFDLIAGRNLVGTWGGETDIERDLPRYVRAYQDNRLPLERLVTHRLPLEKINDAIELMASRQSGRIVIVH